MSGWQAAMGTLAREKELAESAAGLLKGHAARDAAGMVRGQQLYAQAKAASDALVERLEVAVREGDDPGRSPDLRTAMAEAVARRESFTRHVEERLPRDEGTKSATILALLALLAAAKPGAEAAKALAEAASTLWKTWSEGQELDRQAMRAGLERLRWRSFADVPEAL